MTVKFREVGNSITITIPKDIVKQFNLVQGMEADVEAQNGSIVVKPKKEEKVTIKSLFAGYNGDYVPSEIDWGEARGNEV
ncbi:MAG: AbrB/MazE/SpoVT family DNA-binding domain-containing protein [Eubacterium sp.]|nr:AbrB/MazE/SpoVT family DNA-binding domain-containing protein [Eubacterium sp.]